MLLDPIRTGTMLRFADSTRIITVQEIKAEVLGNEINVFFVVLDTQPPKGAGRGPEEGPRIWTLDAKTMLRYLDMDGIQVLNVRNM